MWVSLYAGGDYAAKKLKFLFWLQSTLYCLTGTISSTQLAFDKMGMRQ